MTDITELAQLRAELSNQANGSKDHLRKLALLLVEALEKAQGMEAYWKTQCRGITDHCEVLQARIAELESCTVKLPDGWQFEECEIEGCENGAIFSVGTGSRNIHLCDKCAHEPQNSRLKKSPLSKRLPFKMSAGIKVEAE